MPGPQDQLARDLAAALGSNLAPCRKQIAALVQHGMTLDEIRPHVDTCTPGMNPWAWTRSVVGEPTTGNRSDSMIKLAERLESEGR